ncbi:MAG: DUF664 domain-containing protein [Micropruina glycogenica]
MGRSATTSRPSTIEAYRTAAATSDAPDRGHRTRHAPGPAPSSWWQQAGLAASPTWSHGAVVHVLVETATHAGHLDAARELIDGTQYLVLD